MDISASRYTYKYGYIIIIILFPVTAGASRRSNGMYKRYDAYTPRADPKYMPMNRIHLVVGAKNEEIHSDMGRPLRYCRLDIIYSENLYIFADEFRPAVHICILLPPGYVCIGIPMYSYLNVQFFLSSHILLTYHPGQRIPRLRMVQALFSLSFYKL